MQRSSWPDRLARGWAVLRGLVLVLFMVALIAAPERAMPGSSAEPARSLALTFASRTLLLGVALAVLALMGKRRGLAWLLLADALLQLFDAGLAVSTGKQALAPLPLAIGAVDAWAGLWLLRGARTAPREELPRPPA